MTCLWRSWLAVLFLAIASACKAQDAPLINTKASDAPTETRATVDAPDGPLSSGDEKIDTLLDRLEARGKSVLGLKSKLTYTHVIVDPVESRKVKEGELLFARAEPNYRFYVHFDRHIADGVVSRSGEYFAFDGRWLIERNDRAKNVIKRELAREGQYRDPFKLGEGPFPLPFGQRRGDMLKNFRVCLEPFAIGDPLQTDHLRCVPRPGTDLAKRYSRVDIYIDRRIDLPVRIVTENLKDGNRIEVDFKDISTGEAPAASRFAIEEPKDYDIRIERLDDSPEDGAAP